LGDLENGYRLWPIGMVPIGRPKIRVIATVKSALSRAQIISKERRTLMKTTLKLVAVAVVLFGMSGAANAFVINYVMDLRTAGQWTLWANTDAPGGIASAVVDVGSGADAAANSVAPRGMFGATPIAGFTLGNIFAAKQAFTGQNTTTASSIAYGVGFSNVGDAAFSVPPAAMIGGGSGNLTFLDLAPADDAKELNGFVKLYTGTGNLGTTVDTAFKGGAAGQPAAFGVVFSAAGTPTVVGPTVQPGANLTAGYAVLVPEPGTIVLVGMAVPALAMFIRRRKTA
jgi:hypothetical protein